MTDAMILNIIMSLLALAGTFGVFVQPLRRRANRMQWMLFMPVMLALCAGCLWLSAFYGGFWPVAAEIVLFCAVAAMVNRMTRMSIPADCYCAVWIVVTAKTVVELWMNLDYFIPAVRSSVVWEIGSFLLLCAVVLPVVHKTLAQSMPQNDIYQIGPRQLSSALVLGAMFTVCYYFQIPEGLFAGMMLVCQVFCLTLLYLQTELFKKVQMQKDMDTLNFLYDQQQQNYELSRQNLRVVNEKSRALDEMITKVRQYLPEELRSTVESAVADAVHLQDSAVDSGSIVLDTVLTEKKLLAEARGIPISCVADGKLLNFMDAADIYAVFSNALDNAIEAVSEIPDRSRRMIDVLVYESQNFMVINISNPLKGSLEFEEDLPITTKGVHRLRGFGLKVMRQCVEKYRGILAIRTVDGLFTVKIVVPLPRT